MCWLTDLTGWQRWQNRRSRFSIRKAPSLVYTSFQCVLLSTTQYFHLWETTGARESLHRSRPRSETEPSSSSHRLIVNHDTHQLIIRIASQKAQHWLLPCTDSPKQGAGPIFHPTLNFNACHILIPWLRPNPLDFCMGIALGLSLDGDPVYLHLAF